jgi:hypothetical protein
MTCQQIDSSPGSGPPIALVRAELNGILASELFTRSKRLSAFLKFIVDRTLAGQGDSLKEQVIALRGMARDHESAVLLRVSGQVAVTLNQD